MHCHCFYYLSVIVLNSSLVYLMSPGPFLALSEFSFDFRIFFIIQKYSFVTFFFISNFRNLSASNIPK